MKKDVLSKIGIVRYESNRYIDQELKNNSIDDLHTSHGNVIFTLLKHGPLTMKKLAHEIKRDKSTLTVLINKLIKNDYVKSIPSKTDKRSKLIALTKKGEDIKTVFMSISDNLNNKIWDNISKEEADVFETVLNKMIINLKKEE